MSNPINDTNLKAAKANLLGEEVRIGLVLYGGISLAIYMNGVCNEFFRAVKGEGIYKLVKEIRGCDIVVDIISGSSAGGINGIYLAYCLAHGKDFRETKNHLRDDGDALAFLNKEKRKTFKSLFDSDGSYEDLYIDSFEKLSNKDYVSKNNMESNVDELDLFITGTDFYGDTEENSKEGLDEESKNHGTMFLLKYRKNRKNLFAGEVCINALARLARVTSAFPGAFSPITVPVFKKTELGLENNISVIDQNLRYWSNLNENKKYFFIDGGVVRNKPFSSTVKAIFTRNANREIDRKLFFINPSPDASKKNSHTQNPYPTFFNNITKSIFSISRFQSVKEDFDLVQERNLSLNNYFAIRNSLLKTFLGKGNSNNNSDLPGYYYDLRFEFFASKIKITGELNNKKDFLDKYDLYFRLRRISLVIYVIYDTIYTENFLIKADENEKQNLKVSWNYLNKLIEIYEIMINSIEKLNSGKEISADQFENKIRNTFNFLNDDGIQFNFVSLTTEKNNLAENIYVMLNSKPIDQEKISNPNDGMELFNKISILEEKIIEDIPLHQIQLIHKYFEFFDKVLFPIQMNSRILEKDKIEIIRFSPMDAKIGLSGVFLSKDKNEYENKICGELMFHFGAFLKRSWRANDIMWGRLDGCCQIVEALFDISELNNEKIMAYKEKLRETVNENNIKEYFPNITDKLSEELINKKNMFCKTPSPSDKNIFIEFRNLLIEAEQVEIAMEEKVSIEAALSDEKGSKSLIEVLSKMNYENVKSEFRTNYNLGKEGFGNIRGLLKFKLISTTLIILWNVIAGDSAFRNNIKLNKLIFFLLFVVLFLLGFGLFLIYYLYNCVRSYL